MSEPVENAALRLQYPAIWPLHFWDSIRVTHPRQFCASKRRPVSTRANLEIKFQRIRLGMPSTLYESQTNLPAYPCPHSSPSILSIFRSPCRLSFRHLRHLLRAGKNATIEIKKRSKVSRKGVPSPPRPTGCSVTMRYKRPYLVSSRKLGTFFFSEAFGHSSSPSFLISSFVLSTYQSIRHTFVLAWRQIVVEDRSYVMRQEEKGGRRKKI